MSIKSLIRGEFIGLETEVVGSENKNNIGIKGKIINETKETFTIKGKKTWKIIKSKNIFGFKAKNEKITINGKLINEKPEERIKIRSIKWMKKRKMK